jgi:hypothetical protein
MEADLVVHDNGWDIYDRRFSSIGVGENVTRLNTQLYGDQLSPKIQRAGTNYLAVWTSMGQDGSQAGVFGTFVNDDATASGNELQVNTTTRGPQEQQAIGSDGLGRFLVAWTMLGGRGVVGFDLFGQRYVNPATAVSGTNNTTLNSDPNANTNSISSTAPVILPGPPAPPTNTNPPVIVRNTFNDVKGVYSGLIYDQQNGVVSASSGYVTIATTASGSFTAKMQLGGKSYSFSGQFSASGTNNTKVGPWTINLLLDLHGGDVITGQITGGNSTLSLQANLNVFGKANPAPLAGAYTMVVHGIDSSMGNGIGTATVDSLGNVQWNMTLPDGTKLSEKTALSKTGVWPLYAAPYTGKGIVIGWIQFTGAVSNGFSGQCAWTKPSGSTAPYSGGLTNAISVSGSNYKQPPVAFRAFGGSQVVFTGGGLSAPITNSVNWGPDNKIGNLSLNKLSLSVTPTTGLFKGTVVDPSTGKTVQFQGVLFEKGNVGLGYFSGGNQSGTVSFAPNP